MPFVKSATQTKLVTEDATPRPDRIEGKTVDAYYLSERQLIREQKNADKKTKVLGIKTFYTWYETDGVVFASVNGLSEAAVGQGYHTAVDEDDENAERAKELVDEFGKVMNLDFFLPNICKNMLIAGFCPVETKINKLPSKSALKIIHPKTVKEIVLNDDGSVRHLIQKAQKTGGKDVKILGKNLTLFVHNKIANDPRGTSIIKPIESLLAIKKTALSNIDKIIEKRMFPDIIFKTTRDPAGLSELLAQKGVDEDLVLGWLEPEELKEVAQIVEVRGTTRYEGYIENIDRLIYKGLYAPDLYYWKDATLASAKELTTIVDRGINAIERNMARGVEAGFFDRLMKANNLEAEPKVIWGIEKTGVEDLQMASIIAIAIEVGMFGPKQLEILLNKMGLDVGELGYEVEPEPEEDEFPPSPEEEEPVEDEALFQRALEALTPEVKKKIKRLRISISPERTAEELREDLDQFRGPLLTSEEKKYRLQGLANEIELGEVDEKMIPYLKNINSYPFIVTTQSCTGHGEDRGTGRQAHVDFRCALPIHMVMDELLMPMDERFSPSIFFTLMGLWCDRLRYVMDFDNDTWEDQISYFINLLEPVSEYWNNEETERLIEVGKNLKLVNKQIGDLEIDEYTDAYRSGRYRGTSVGRDDVGYFVMTHRARSVSFPSASDIPDSTIQFIKSTG